MARYSVVFDRMLNRDVPPLRNVDAAAFDQVARQAEPHVSRALGGRPVTIGVYPNGRVTVTSSQGVRIGNGSWVRS